MSPLPKVKSPVEAITCRAAAFAFTPASPRPIGALRILLSATLLFQAYLLSRQIFDLFGRSGVTQEAVTNYLLDPAVPRISWIVSALGRWGVAEPTVIAATCVAYVVALGCLLVGWHTRFASIAAWLLHWTLANSSYCANYGVDTFGHIFLFYLMWMPAGAAMSVDHLVGRTSDAPTSIARLSLRVLQLHLCMMYFASGVEKAAGAQWQNGEVIWRAVMLPVYVQYDMSWLAWFPWLAKILAWGTLLVEIGYPFFIWPRQTRALWVLLTVSLHLGIAVFLGLGTFGAVMAVLTLSVFGVSAEPRGRHEQAPELNVVTA